MRVYILFRDVPFEFGENFGVFYTRDKAEDYKKELFNSGEYCCGIKELFEEQFQIQEWDVE